MPRHVEREAGRVITEDWCPATPGYARGQASFSHFAMCFAAWSDQFSRALCQTVPSPFGLGSSDPEVASCSLHSLSFLSTPSRKACRRRVRCGALAPDHARSEERRVGKEWGK